MRYIFLSYLIILICVLALFILLSFNQGFGYVFVQWHGWQLQTNLFVSLLFFFLIALITHFIWLGLKRVFRRQLQKYQQPKSFSQLHPYEKLGVLWLLHAEKLEEKKITDMYQPSFLLYPLIRARIALAQLNTTSAKGWLKDHATPLFELSELLKIDIALAEDLHDDALNRLEFLSVQPISPWLMPVETAYQQELQDKWLQFAQKCPWLMFQTNYGVEFDAAKKSLWFKALLDQVNASDEMQQIALSKWYEENQHNLAEYYVEDQVTLLKLMSQFDNLNQESFSFAEEILKYRFVPEVLYIWLDKRLHYIGDPSLLEQKVLQWMSQYPAQPSLNFAKWHILKILNRHQEAEDLLTLYPDDPYMAYLRLNEAIGTTPYLQDNLKLLMRYSGQNFKFNL